MIARQGLPFVLVGLVVSTVLVWSALRWDSWWLFASGTMVVLLTLFTVYFFRDPPRRVVVEAGLLLAPADGTILSITPVENQPYIGGRALRISIFLSIFDVHINRIPVSGTIDYVKYQKGKFFAAFEDKASQLNEHTEIGITSEGGCKIIVKQIAGIIARRIVCRLREGDFVSTGDRFGMIRFGSRTDLLVPSGCELQVRAGDHVKGGLTIIGSLPGRTAQTAAADTAQAKNAEL